MSLRSTETISLRRVLGFGRPSTASFGTSVGDPRRLGFAKRSRGGARLGRTSACGISSPIPTQSLSAGCPGSVVEPQ